MEISQKFVAFSEYMNFTIWVWRKKSFWVNDSGLHLRTHLFSKGYRLLARIGGFLQTKMKGNSPWQLCGWIFQQMKWHGCIIGTIHIFAYDEKNYKKKSQGTLSKNHNLTWLKNILNLFFFQNWSSKAKQGYFQSPNYFQKPQLFSEAFLLKSSCLIFVLNFVS